MAQTCGPLLTSDPHMQTAYSQKCCKEAAHEMVFGTQCCFMPSFALFMPLCCSLTLSIIFSIACYVQEQAVLTAERANSAVQHPLLDSVRQHSSNPDAAADFFFRMLHPTPACRLSLDGLQHAYMSQTLADMKSFHAFSSPKTVLCSHALQFDEGMRQEHSFDWQMSLFEIAFILCGL